MAKLITQYDKTLKNKIFSLRGEESYARTTDCVLEEILHNGERKSDWNTHMDYMLLEFRINVLRDVGASTVTLYDNDETIGVYEFDTNSGYIDLKYEEEGGVFIADNRIKLSYDFDHNIYAVYNGNKQSLKSQSKSYNINEHIPSEYVPELRFNDLETNYHTGATVSFTVSLIADDFYNNQPIRIYANDTLMGTYDTGESGITDTISLSNLDDSRYTIRAVFDGDVGNLEYATTETDISVGYIVDLIDYPSYVINDSPSTVTVKVTDYFNNPLNGLNVAISDDTSWEPISNVGVTNNEGIAQINQAYITDSPFYAQTSISIDLISEVYESEKVSISYYDDITIDYSVDTTVTSTNYSITGTAQLSEPISGVAVTTPNGNIVYTDANGRVSNGLSYIGTGAGDVILTASIYGDSDSVDIEDVYQYWHLTTPMNINYEIGFGSVSKQSNGWKLNTSYGGAYIMLKDGVNYFPWVVEYDIVSFSNIVSVDVGNTQFIPISLKSGDHIKYENNPSQQVTNLYKNGTLVRSVSGKYTYYPNISYHTRGSDVPNGYLIVNNLKFKRL